MRMTFQVVAGMSVLLANIVAARKPDARTLRFPPPTETPFLSSTHGASARLHLTDLRMALPGALREIRLWDGFGVTGIRLIILREDQSRWRAFTAYPIDGDSRARIAALPDTTDWARRWQTAVAEGLLQLPAYP